MAMYSVLNPCSGAALVCVKLYGEDAYDIFCQLLPAASPARRPAQNRSYFSPLYLGGEVLDEALLQWRDEGYFLYLHASQAIVAALVAFFEERGVCAVAPPKQSRQQAINLARSRHACHLFGATTLDELRSEIERALSAGDLAALQRLERRSYYALLAQEPRALFLTGPTNAGKSTLFNLLADKELALVSDVRYTTRDALSVAIILAGLELELYDTPGSGSFEDAREDRKSYDHFESLLGEADMVVYFHPLDQPLPPPREAQAGELHVYSKLDLASADQRAALPAGALAFSARTGEGMAELKAALARTLYAEEPPQPGETLCFSKKQWEIVTRLCIMVGKNGHQAMEYYKDNEEVFC